MISRLVWLSLLLPTTGWTQDDIRDRVADVEADGGVISEIDPDRHVFGLPWRSSEDEVIEILGQPSGFLRLRNGDSVMLFGPEIALHFRDANLQGVTVDDFSLIDGELGRELLNDSPLSRLQWELINGVGPDMNAAEVQEAMEGEIEFEEHGFYRGSLETKAARIDFSFAGSSARGDDELEGYRLMGLHIELLDEEP